jgi:hypothetical protein
MLGKLTQAANVPSRLKSYVRSVHSRVMRGNCAIRMYSAVAFDVIAACSKCDSYNPLAA